MLVLNTPIKHSNIQLLLNIFVFSRLQHKFVKSNETTHYLNTVCSCYVSPVAQCILCVNLSICNWLNAVCQWKLMCCREKNCNDPQAVWLHFCVCRLAWACEWLCFVQISHWEGGLRCFISHTHTHTSLTACVPRASEQTIHFLFPSASTNSYHPQETITRLSFLMIVSQSSVSGYSHLCTMRCKCFFTFR